MWKSIILVLIAMTTFIGGMLLWQWKAYSKQNNLNNESTERAIQEITVHSNEKELQISQKIIGLTSGKEYKVSKPDSLFHWSCKDKEGKACDSGDENPNTFKANQNQLVFEYTIPVQTNGSAFLLNEWVTNIPDLAITSSSIEIIDKARRGGTWIAGAPIKGYKEMDLIDYYYFDGIGIPSSLYWQPKPIQKKQSEMEKVFLYGSQGLENMNHFQEIKSLKGFPFVSVVFTDQYHEENGKGIMIVSPNTNEDELKQKLINYYFEKKFKDISKDQYWIIDVFTSYTINEAAKTTKGKAILEELGNKLSEEELNSFFKKASECSEMLTLKQLDHYLSELKGWKSKFFISNGERTDSIIPLYFYDFRKVIVSGKEEKGIEVVIDQEKRLFPFVQTMEALGYDVQVLSDKETIFLAKGRNSYRFFLNQNIFIYNEEDYGLLESPLLNINGNIYMNKEWIETLFKVNIEVGNEEINISL
ncbi:stalk domain-containing protein [Cytobacillus dafuensis]|nr:stalk domain-containing protein [Cytobacillus dafuensis]